MTATQSSTSQTGSPPKKKICPEAKDDPLHEDNEWCDKFNEVDGGAPAHAEGSDRTQNIENHD